MRDPLNPRCDHCNSTSVVFDDREDTIGCLVCGTRKKNDTLPLVYTNNRSYNNCTAYKRINHFNEWLTQFQAKENTSMPEEVYQMIRKCCAKNRIRDMRTITPQKMRKILKSLSLSKYYEHIPHILSVMNGQKPPNIDRQTEDKLRSMFRKIQIPFIKHCPSYRKNFLSYSYVLYKFVDLLGLDHLKKCFPLLKSRDKLHIQDKIWVKICKELRWEFRSSI